MLPEFPKARQKMLELWNKAFFSSLHRSHPFLADIAIRVQKEGTAAFIGGSEINYKRAASTCSFDMRRAEGMSPEEFFGMATQLGSELGRQQAEGVFQAMSIPSPHSRPVQWSGPLQFETFLDTWEKMEINFGEDDLPQWPAVVLGKEALAEVRAKLPQWLEDPKNKEKWSELVERKRKEFDEREARRRLVD
jgi:hypothetical protein